jgi:Uma2 family endonuclease
MSTIIQESTSTPKIPPTIYYPESDGEPMAETDTHRKQISYGTEVLEIYFQDEPDVYVTGNIMFYYVEGDPTKVTSPDVMVVRGVPKGERPVFKLWEEKPPVVAIEFSSRKTWKEDLQKKWKLYQELGVLEYYIFDPEYDYLDEPLLAYKLINGEFVQIEVKDGRVFSEALGLELIDTGVGLRLFDPKTQQFLMTPLEEHNARVREQEAREQAEIALQEKELALRQEADARQQAEGELLRLHAEVERLTKSKK